MSVWYASKRPTGKSDKFLSLKRLGAQHAGLRTYKCWTYQLLSITSGASLTRTSHNVAISDPQGNAVEYLCGFMGSQQAASAAENWIDRHLGDASFAQADEVA